MYTKSMRIIAICVWNVMKEVLSFYRDIFQLIYEEKFVKPTSDKNPHHIIIINKF